MRFQTKKEKGHQGENRAIQYLREHGYEIKERNWRFSYSEIDIIAWKKPILVFVEVKTRDSISFAEDVPLVSERQEQALARGAEAYMSHLNYQDEIRFDTIFVLTHADGEYSIEHHKDSFFPDWG